MSQRMHNSMELVRNQLYKRRIRQSQWEIRNINLIVNERQSRRQSIDNSDIHAMEESGESISEIQRWIGLEPWWKSHSTRRMINRWIEEKRLKEDSGKIGEKIPIDGLSKRWRKIAKVSKKSSNQTSRREKESFTKNRDLKKRKKSRKHSYKKKEKKLFNLY